MIKGKRNLNSEKDETEEKAKMLEGLKKYQNRGINIIIDGKDSEEKDWNRIFEVREDDSFYMADFVSDEDTGCLREIRFDRVYYK